MWSVGGSGQGFGECVRVGGGGLRAGVRMWEGREVRAQDLGYGGGLGLGLCVSRGSLCSVLPEAL